MIQGMKRILSLAVFLFAVSASFAEEAAPVATSPTFAELFRSGGSLMWVLSLLSIFALANVVYLFVTLRESVTVPRAVLNDVMDKLQAGDLGEARKVCDYSPCPFSHVATAAVDALDNLPDADASVVTSVVEGEGARQAGRLQGRTQWLLDIASIAPMVGLLGTVLGMLTAFQGVGGDTIASAKPVILAQGVSLALITTIAGLVVAIPCMAFYAWFRRQADRQVAALECAAADVVTVLLARRRK